MNVLLRLRKDMVITNLVPFRYLLYSALLSNVVVYKTEEEDTKWGVYAEDIGDVYDYFSDWGHSDDSRNEVLLAFNALGEEGLLLFDDSNDKIYLGEYRGKKFFTFEQKNSTFDQAITLYEEQVARYGKSRSAKDKSRSKYIKEKMTLLLNKGVDKFIPSDFMELHGYMYEVYTGGEIYIIRNKVEYFQTNNMLKAYDKFTVFSLIVEGTLNYDKHRKKGIPTLTNVACMKDDVFRIMGKASDSKEYMREETEGDEGGF